MKLLAVTTKWVVFYKVNVAQGVRDCICIRHFFPAFTHLLSGARLPEPGPQDVFVRIRENRIRRAVLFQTAFASLQFRIWYTTPRLLTPEFLRPSTLVRVLRQH